MAASAGGGGLVPYFIILPLLAKTRQLALDQTHGQFRYFTTVFGLALGAWRRCRVSKVIVKPFTQDEPAVRRTRRLRSGPPRARVVLLSVPAIAPGHHQPASSRRPGVRSAAALPKQWPCTTGRRGLPYYR
ncbi:MAG: hypothetical protein WKG07_15910 [Hymenobacter sp.]